MLICDLVFGRSKGIEGSVLTLAPSLGKLPFGKWNIFVGEYLLRKFLYVGLV